MYNIFLVERNLESLTVLYICSVTDGGTGGEPVCPGKWKRCRKKNMNSNANVMYIHVCPVSCNIVVMFAEDIGVKLEPL